MKDRMLKHLKDEFYNGLFANATNSTSGLRREVSDESH